MPSVNLKPNELNAALLPVDPNDWPGLAARAMVRMNGAPFHLGAATVAAWPHAGGLPQIAVIQFDVTPDGLDSRQIKAALR
jgi:hypothetical protein